MSLVRYFNSQPQPFLTDEFLNSLTQGCYQWAPDLDVSEEKDGYTVKVDLPGLKKEDVQVSFDNGVLTIAGERKNEAESKEKEYHRIERSYGRFARSLQLGTGVDASKIDANYKDGVLEIKVAKLEKAQPKAIDIKVA